MKQRLHTMQLVRLAQLAMLVSQSSRLFSRFRQASSLEEATRLLTVTANDFWHYRFAFDKPSSFQPKTIGRRMADNVVVNTVAPFLHAYAALTGEIRLREKAIHWLRDTEAETNRATEVFHLPGRRPESALESQGLLELRTNYCERRRCLECDVCAALMSRTSRG